MMSTPPLNPDILVCFAALTSPPPVVRMSLPLKDPTHPQKQQTNGLPYICVNQAAKPTSSFKREGLKKKINHFGRFFY